MTLRVECRPPALTRADREDLVAQLAWVLRIMGIMGWRSHQITVTPRQAAALATLLGSEPEGETAA